MPIYEYRCASCGHQEEFLRKASAEPLTVCTRCGKETFSKMLSAAGFQLKGSGWYATDFKGKTPAPAKVEGKDGKDSGADKPAEAKKEAAPACGAGASPSCT